MTQVEGSTQLGRISRSVRRPGNCFARQGHPHRVTLSGAATAKVKVVEGFANWKDGKRSGILEKVQEVHDADRSQGSGLTEYEWNRYNRGSENT